MNLAVGVDIGGTKIAAGLVASSGVLLATAARPTPAVRGRDAILDTVTALVRELLTTRPGDGDVVAVGVGSAGVVDPRRGVVLSATRALAGWAGTDLRGELSRRLGLRVAVDNDVHAHALGEQWRGAAAGRRDVLLVTVGTGVGASIVLDGRIRHGAHSVAGHAGHMTVAAAAGRPCPCGGRGHVEAVASGPALLGEYSRRTGTDSPDLTEVARLAADGDPVAGAVLAEGGAALGSMIGGLVNVIDPEIVVIGGGVAGCGEPWWRAVRETIGAEVLPALRDIPVEPAALGGSAALLGAARMAFAAARDREPSATS
ncbi:ROK family protein [Thermostaphylospora chromogena]|uniref:Glucokinase n=1 Tax=Thermostaphylospora chromogena TaxID=35622 RepID=A0A1H1A2L5_9ACTN|nr:ROK family protein [Thermostaphylospora chromogena]SDQ33945.1 glucokinase [Thermostaphylospora chromogena]